MLEKFIGRANSLATSSTQELCNSQTSFPDLYPKPNRSPLLKGIITAIAVLGCSQSFAVYLDSDGIADIADIDDDNDGILDRLERTQYNNEQTVIYVHENNGKLSSITDPAGTPVISAIGTMSQIMGDIAMAPNGTLYGITLNSARLYTINKTTAATTLVGSVSGLDNGSSLSFDKNGIAYAGGSAGGAVSGKIYKFNPANPAGATTWYDFGTGYPGGDLVFIEDSAYLIWASNGAMYLRKAALNAANNVTSTTTLGDVSNGAWGLTADATGLNLYLTSYGDSGFGLYQFEIPNSEVTGQIPKTLVAGTALSSGQYYGATSNIESVVGLTQDTDGDGIADHRDLDSDNDGISDLQESGAAGVALDADENGTLTVAETADTDNDGLMDVFEDGNLSTDTGTTPADSDTDATQDYLDLDSDYDGIPDAVEAQLTAGYATAFANDGNVSNDDTDGDGAINIHDTFAGFGGSFNTPVNTDGTDLADYLDLNSDNDGETDAEENGADITTAATYADPNGSINNPSTDLSNEGGDTTQVAYREDSTPPAAPVIVVDEDTNNDGFVNSSELTGNVNLTITLPVDAVVGDTLMVSDGTNSNNITLTAAQISSRSVTSVLAPPADGSALTYTALVTDAAGNNSPGASDTAIFDIASHDVPVIVLTEDTSNDGLISSSELNDLIDVTVTIPATAATGDTLTVTDGTTTNTIVLTQTQVDDLSATTTFAAGNDGDVLTVSATLTDPAGNTSTSATDSASYDVTAPQMPAVMIAEDINDDGVISSTELTGNVDVMVTLPIDAVAGDTVLVDDGTTTNTIVLTTADINAGSVATDFPAGNNNDTVVIGASVTDTAGNMSATATDTATYDITAPAVPVIVITEDTSNDALISFPELNGLVDVTVTLPVDASPGDTLVVTDGTTANTFVLTAADITTGSMSTSFPATSLGDTLTVTAAVIDSFGNASTTATDSAAYDLSSDTDGDGIPDRMESTSDTDGDGDPDYLDTDSDDDGIPDSVEDITTPALLNTDTDNDGIDDAIDVDATGGADADNDGIDDAMLPTDSDDDGVADYIDLDSDNDTITDSAESATDSDDDGIPNFRDLDSDADGINDIIEGGAADADDDGTVDGFTDADGNGADDTNLTDTTPDSDADGTPDVTDTDSDNDGIPDSIEAGTGALLDTDNDGTPNYQDIDSDNDGISDGLEVGGDPAAPTDTDGDGTPDYLEPASDLDRDGLPDRLEGTGDTDGDGVSDYLDTDSDDDGIPDSVEASFEGVLPADRDNDGVYDFLDVDADNDGISDASEGFEDTDSDGVLDFRDLDVDNDGIFDIIEARIGMTRVNELDSDLDGIIDLTYTFGPNGMADTVEATAESGIENYSLPNIDGDSVDDYRDLDSDKHGLLDTLESDHRDENLDGVIDTASSVQFDDRNRTVAAVDTQTGLATNAGGAPRNTDNDDLADFRDADSDNDGVMDVVESFGAASDANNDGMLDDFSDSDGNGVDDNMQASPVAPVDTDADGSYDAIEIDSDADGIRDIVEVGGDDVDNDGMVDNFLDVNADGVDDAIAAVPLLVIDTDGDNTPDFQDRDSDDDGLSDIEESGGIDADGDGAADSFVSTATLPDEDGDGVPDFQQTIVGSTGNTVNTGDTNVPAAEQGNPRIITGLQGGGCVIASTSSGVDPLLPGISLFALLCLLRTSGRRGNNEQ